MIICRGDFDELAVTIVCSERVPMALTGADRWEAIRRLYALGVDIPEVARLTKSCYSTVAAIERQLSRLECAL